MVKAVKWPNGLGWNVTLGNRRYEVHERGVRRLTTDRETMAGFTGDAYCTVETCAPRLTPTEAVAVVRSVPAWTPCEAN